MSILDRVGGDFRKQYATPLALVYILLALFALLLVLNPFRIARNALRKRRPIRHKSAAIVVLGDVGRSPRMMYHAESFARMEWETFIVGYKGSKLIPSLLEVPHVREIYLPEPPAFITKLPKYLFLLWAPYKVAFQIWTVLLTLLSDLPYTPEFVLVQNPPSIPTLAIVQLVCHLTGSKLIIDWHNLGWTILALRLGKSNPVVSIARWFERTFGKHAYAHLFVTHAMQEALVTQWGLQGIKLVLHDRPPAHFHPSETTEIHDLFSRLDLSPAGEGFFPPFTPPLSTPFTSLHSLPPSSATSPTFGTQTLPQLRPDRPALVVSSTSWTADEDFSLLLMGMQFYEKLARAANAPPPVSYPSVSWTSERSPPTRYAAQTRPAETEGRLPKMLVVVTGKGPLRDKFWEDIEEVQKLWQWVRCVPMWLEAADYPLLLGSADLGVSLHSSSSGLDLPMKIVDMFGCGLPVCALDFACLPELVKEGENGLVFKGAQELARHFEMLLRGFPQASELKKLRQRLARQGSTSVPEGERWTTWAEEWDRVVRPILTSRAGAQRER